MSVRGDLGRWRVRWGRGIYTHLCEEQCPDPISQKRMSEVHSPCSHGPQLPSPPSSSTPNYVLTLIAVTDGAKVHIVLVVGEEEKAEPGVEGVDGHNEEDAHDVALLIGPAVTAQMHVDLGKGHQSVKTYCYHLPPSWSPALVFLHQGKSGAPDFCLCSSCSVA